MEEETNKHVRMLLCVFKTSPCNILPSRCFRSNLFFTSVLQVFLSIIVNFILLNLTGRLFFSFALWWNTSSATLTSEWLSVLLCWCWVAACCGKQGMCIDQSTTVAINDAKMMMIWRHYETWQSGFNCLLWLPTGRGGYAEGAATQHSIS